MVKCDASGKPLRLNNVSRSVAKAKLYGHQSVGALREWRSKRERGECSSLVIFTGGDSIPQVQRSVHVNIGNPDWLIVFEVLAQLSKIELPGLMRMRVHESTKLCQCDGRAYYAGPAMDPKAGHRISCGLPSHRLTATCETVTALLTRASAEQ